MNSDSGWVWVLSGRILYIRLAERVHAWQSLQPMATDVLGLSWAAHRRGEGEASWPDSGMKLGFDPKPNREKKFLSNIQNPL
jgi:hypothetical protein